MNDRYTHLPGTRERGIALVEFVIAVPILLLLMLATGELGRAFYQYSALTKAVEDGARYLSGAGIANNPAGVIVITPQDQTTTQNLVVFGTPAGSSGGPPLLPGLTTGAVTITQVDLVRVRVSATYSYQPILASGIPTFGYGSGPISTAFTMTTSVTMRAL